MANSGAGAAASRMSVLLLLLVAVFAGSSLAQAPDNRTEVAAAAARKCTYTVKVKTSCASPARTSDAVSVAFGDAYRNEAYGARLPGGGSTFERCGADIFHVSGACGYGVCYLYLRRAGRDGWAPQWVQVAEPGPSEKPTTFYFDAPLPDGVWYGHNRCPKAKADTARTTAALTNTSSSASAAAPLG